MQTRNQGHRKRSVHPGSDLKGRPHSFGIARRQQTEQRIQLQTAALAAAANGIVITDREGTVIWVNPAFTRLTGYAAEEAVGQNLRILHSGRHDRSFYKNLWDTILAGQVWHGEIINRRKDGGLYTEEQTITPVRDTHGGITHFIAIKQDVTERKRAEERIRREAARADALARVAARLNALLTLDAVLDAVCEEAADALRAPAASITLYDRTRAVLFPAATFGLPPGYLDDCKPYPRHVYDEYVRQHGSLIVLPDVQAIPGLPNLELYVRHDIRTIVIASLIRGTQLIGTLNLYTFGQPRAFSADELALLKGLSDQAAQAVENARLRAQAEKAAVAAERSRLARDLHDSVTQALYSLTLYAEATARLLPLGEVDLAVQQSHEMRNTAQQALQEMRLLIYELRPPVLEQQGLVAALQDRLDAVEGRAGLHTQLKVEGDGRLPLEIEEGLYRIAQEALNNALKHAQARQVTVHLHQGAPATVLEITDDGVGFDPTAIEEKGGLGLRGLEERVQRIGGTLKVESAPGKGTKVRITVGLWGNSRKLGDLRFP